MGGARGSARVCTGGAGPRLSHPARWVGGAGGLAPTLGRRWQRTGVCVAVVRRPDEMYRAGMAGGSLGVAVVSEVHDRDTAAEQLELPADRIGVLTVLSDRHVVLGRTPADHDLQLLSGGLRGHGGRYEEMVPLLFSHPLNEHYLARAGDDPRNFDIFEFACNGVVL